MSSTLSGGKYTRELKLRVLEHYFRNGGDVFGNKQSTSKKFGVDSKTINRFLKIHDLVRLARKNAKSSGKSSNSGANFKEPMVPGGSGRPQRQAAKPSVRINLPEEPDEAIINQTSEGNLSSVGKLLKVFELGSQEIRDLLLAECDLVYECRVCRGLFRSLANLLSHKRHYCTRAHCETRQVFGDGPGQSLSAPSDGVLVLPLPDAIDRLPEVRQAAAEQARAAAARPVPALRLERLSGTQVALAQTLGQPEVTVGQQLSELAQLEAASSGRTVRVGADGKAVEDSEEPEPPADAAGDNVRDDACLTCQLCNTTFSTRKALSYHARSAHASTRVYYPCCFCSASFINMFSVERHLQKAHKKSADEVDTLKKAIRQKAFQRNTSQTELLSPQPSTKVTSFEWKCRQCNRRYLSLPVALQHVQTLHPQFATPRAGLVRVCRVVRQSSDATVSTRSSSGRVTPGHDDTAEDADDGDADAAMTFNKANLLTRLGNGGERCVLCLKEFTSHVQACGHLRLHDQAQIETYLGQKVRLTKRKKPVAVLQEEYELDEAAATNTDGEEEPEESDEEVGSAPRLGSVQSRGYPVHMVAADGVRRRDFIHADLQSGTFVCTLCESPFDRVQAVRAHMARHSLEEVRDYVAQHAADGLVGVPVPVPSEEADPVQPVEEDADDGNSVDTDIEAGAKLLVSCKLWSPDRSKVAGDGTNSASECEEDEDMEADDEAVDAVDSELLAKEINGEIVDKWEAIRRKGDRLRCVVCNRTFMKTISAEHHLRNDHSFEEIRLFLNKWPFKGIRVPPRESPADENREEATEDGAAETRVAETASTSAEKSTAERIANKTTAPSPTVPASLTQKKPTVPPPPVPILPKGVKRMMEGGALPAGKVIKIARRATPAGAVAAPKVGTIGPNTKILKISRSDLLVHGDGGSCSCLVCDQKFATHALACTHMRQHSDADIRNFIKTRGREFLPAFELKSKNQPKVSATSGGACAGVGAKPVGAATPVASQHKAHVMQVPLRTPDDNTAIKDKEPSASNVPAAPSTPAAGAESSTSAIIRKADSQPKPTADTTKVKSEPVAEEPAPAAPEVAEKRRLSQRGQDADDSDSSTAEESDELERDDAVREFETFDKVQLLQRGSDSTKCLLCRRVFSKYGSACGHLSHHSTQQVQEWREKISLKAASLLKKAASSSASVSSPSSQQRVPSVQDEVVSPSADDSQAGVSSASSSDRLQTPAEAKKQRAGSVSEPTETMNRIESVVKPAVLAPYKQISQRSLENVAKRLKAAHLTMERVDYEPKVPKQVQSPKPAAVVASAPSNMDELHLKGVSVGGSVDSVQGKSAPSTEDSGKNPPDVKSLPSVEQVSAAAITPTAQSDLVGKSSSPKQKPTINAQSTISDPEQSKQPFNQKLPSRATNVISEPVSAVEKISSVPLETAKLITVNANASIAAKPSALAVAEGNVVPCGRTMKLAIRMPALSASAERAAAISTVMVGGKQLQAMKLAVVPSTSEGPLAGRTIMRLAPGMKLPVTAVPVQRMLRPIAPKAVTDAAALSPQRPPAPVEGVVSPRPRPPPLMRAPLLQMTAAGGSRPVQMPAPTGSPVKPRPEPSPPAATAAAKPNSTNSTDARKPTVNDEKAGADAVKSRLGAAGEGVSRSRENVVKPRASSADGRLAAATPVREGEEKTRPLHTYQKKQAPASSPSSSDALRLNEAKNAAVKSPKVTPHPVKTASQAQRPVVKQPLARASTPTAKSSVVTKRSFIPDVVPVRSWSPRDAVSDDSLRQTRARAEAAMMARVRQTRRKSAGASSNRK